MALLTHDVENYIAAHSRKATALLQELERETREYVPIPEMLSGPVVGQALKILVQLTQAKRVLEIGTYTGYSALWMAQGLKEDGLLITCDVNPGTMTIAERYFKKSPDAHKIKTCLGDARQTVLELNETFDFVFIDADKESYAKYYEASLPKVRQGGLIVFDNCLRNGHVLNPQEPGTIVIDQLNRFLATDLRVENVILSVRDGLHIVRKL